MDAKEQAYKDFKKGMKYKDIAEKYGVTESAVKSWASRYWKKEKVATKNKKSCNPSGGKLQPKKRGLNGSPPLGNTNALKHGGYSAIYWDTLDETERELIESMPQDEENLLVDQIRLYGARERRIMTAINKYRDMNGGLAVSGVSASFTKREFDSPEDKEQYEDLRQEKIAEGCISYLGYDKQTLTSTEATINIIRGLETELTRVQNAKTKAIAQLSALRAARRAEEEKHARTENEGLLGDFLQVIQEANDRQV